MQVYVIRHGLSEANNYNNIGTPAFGNPDAPLMQLGIEQARLIPAELLADYGLADYDEAVATSQLLRTQQTAHEAGFHSQRSYGELNEIEPSTVGVDRLAIKGLIRSGRLPDQVVREAEQTLNSPPKECLWFTHGLRIAGICKVLGQHQDASLVPRFCEIRELTL